jgi:hypothetical protein
MDDGEEIGLRIRFVVNAFVVPCVVLFGVLGNALSIVVLGRDRIQPSTAFTLRALAAADITFLIFAICFTTIPTLIDEHIDSLSLRSQTHHHLFILYAHPIYHATQMVSTWTLVLVTLERYILVCKPLHAVKFVTIKKLSIGITIIWIAALVFQVPLFFQTGCIVKLVNSSSISCNQFLHSPPPTDTGGKVGMTLRIVDPLYHLIYRTLGYFLLRFILPFIILIYLSARLAQEIQRSRMRHDAIYASVLSNNNHSNSSQERQGKYTRIVVTIVTLFCICLLPQAIFLLLLTLRNYKKLQLPADFTFAFDSVASLLLTVNSSSNFIIYCVMRENFRKLLRKMICKKRHDPLTLSAPPHP